MLTEKNFPSPSGKRIFSLKAILITFLIPIAVIIAGTAVLSYEINSEIRSYTRDLEQETISNVLLAQRNSSNLQSLRSALQELVYAGDSKRARRAFVNAWGMLSESTFDRHEDTKQSTDRLLKSLKETWLVRKNYDSKRSEVNETFRSLYFHLLMATGLAAGLKTSSVDLLQVPAQRFLLHLDDGEQHKRHLQELQVAAKDLCSKKHTPRDKTRASLFIDHCQAIQALPPLINSELTELNAIKNDFLAYIQVMKTDAVKLRQEYSVIETSDLLYGISKTSQFYERILSIFLTVLFVVIALTLLLSFSFYLLIKPLIELTGQMRHFLATNEMPKLRSSSRIREINDVLTWLMRFCDLIREKRARENELSIQYDRLLISSHLDSLTGLYNRQALEEFIESEKELPANTCVLMLDIDHFKPLNDTMGHLFGDRILSVFGRHIRQCIPYQDHIYRYGGEEFCIVLNGVTPRAARDTAERLCRKIKQISRSDASIVTKNKTASDPLTVSIGISSVTAYTGHIDAITLIREADIALYEAKKAGRDRVWCFSANLPHKFNKQITDGSQPNFRSSSSKEEDNA